MRDFLSNITDGYNSLFGTSKIVPVVFLMIAAVILLYNEEALNDGCRGVDISDSDRLLRRRRNPAVFLLSVYSGISYAAVVLYRRSKSLLVLLFLSVIICMTGELVFSENALKKSIYTNGEFFEIVFSVVAIAFYFLIYGLIAMRLFDCKADDKREAVINRLLFMCSMALLNLFGFYSERLSLSTLLLSPLSVSSVILHGILPLALWLYLVYEDKIIAALESYAVSTETEDDKDYEEEWDMKKHRILNMKNMAAAVLVIVICFAIAVMVLNNKINTLYDATVLLNNAASDKASIYEVKNDGEICASVIVSSDGNVTVIGGGSRTNGTSLYEELSKQSLTVSTWYLYGEDEESTGAYSFCKENGISVDNTYVLSTVRIDE